MLSRLINGLHMRMHSSYKYWGEHQVYTCMQFHGTHYMHKRPCCFREHPECVVCTYILTCCVPPIKIHLLQLWFSRVHMLSWSCHTCTSEEFASSLWIRPIKEDSDSVKVHSAKVQEVFLTNLYACMQASLPACMLLAKLLNWLIVCVHS